MVNCVLYWLVESKWLKQRICILKRAQYPEAQRHFSISVAEPSPRPNIKLVMQVVC
jgi:hypothetical protein